MIKRAEIRMADEIDAAQQAARSREPSGDVRDRVRTSGTVPATLDELGISSQRVAEWRELRDAGEHVIDEPSRPPSTKAARRPTPTSSARSRTAPPHAVHRRERMVHAGRVHRGGAGVPGSHRPRSGDRSASRRKPSARPASSPATTTACATSGADGSGSTRRTRSRTSRASSTSCSPRSPPAGRRRPFCSRTTTPTPAGFTPPPRSAPPSASPAGGSGS